MYRTRKFNCWWLIFQLFICIQFGMTKYVQKTSFEHVSRLSIVVCSRRCSAIVEKISLLTLCSDRYKFFNNVTQFSFCSALVLLNYKKKKHKKIVGFVFETFFWVMYYFLKQYFVQFVMSIMRSATSVWCLIYFRKLNIYIYISIVKNN